MTSTKSKLWSFSAVGRDRPGIVAALSKVFYEHDCNLSDSQMTILAEQFAIVMILESGGKTVDEELAKAVQELGEQWKLQVRLAPVDSEIESASNFRGPTHLVSVYGADQAGITWKVAAKLAEHNFNVTDLSTKKVGGKTPIYILLLETEAKSEEASLSELESALKTLGKELGCSVTVKPIESESL